MEKQTFKELKNYLKAQNVKALDWQEIPKAEVAQQSKIALKIEPESSNSRPNFEFKYERYEWHLKTGFENDRDVVLFK